MDKVAIIVVTYKRQQLLSELLDSFLKLTVAPWRVVVVDNENSVETARVVENFRERLNAYSATALWHDGGDAVVYAPQTENTGGAGGFSAGVQIAYEMGADWFWLMDDDVVVIPDSLKRLVKWMPDHGVVQGSRLDYDGGPFYWQYRFASTTPLPRRSSTSPASSRQTRHALKAVCSVATSSRRSVFPTKGSSFTGMTVFTAISRAR